MNMLTCITIFNLFSLPLVYSFGAEWTDTTFATYPFVANIRLHGTLYCGGSIVSLNPGIILTAGYCVVGGNGEQIDPLSDRYEVWIGCTQSSCVQPNGEPTLYRVSRYEVHEGYVNEVGVSLSNNNIGLLFLSSPIDESRPNAISLLPSMDGIGSGQAVRAISYGGTDSSDTDTLETHITNIVSNADCATGGWGDFVLTGTDKICVEDGSVEGICGPNGELNGALCYPVCRSGYYGVGPVCWSYCDSGCDDHGALCWCDWFDIRTKRTYGRTAGYLPDYTTQNKQQGFGRGDGGSPIVFEDGGERYLLGFVIGIKTSPSPQGMTPEPRVPSTLTSVPHYYDWITDRIR